MDKAGYNSSVVTADGRVLFGEYDVPGNYWTWKDGVLSTILDGANNPGVSTTAVAPDGSVFFGEYNDPGSFWQWSPAADCDARGY